MKQEALVGRTIAGKYEIEALVGEGAMGCVYRARQTTLGTTLAIKVLHRPLAHEPMFAARFLREAQAASRVDHPSSMRVVDFGEEPDGLLYIAMEYVDGKTLAKLLQENGTLPVARIVDIACQTLAALAVAHDLGVVHRDLKPENIMLVSGRDDEGREHDLVKVCDFGVAKLLEGGGRAPSVTAEGLVIGTPEYMSPEQARGEGADARSDIYAMGVLLFHMMTGKIPFDSSSAFATAFMHVNDEPTQPRLLNPRADSRLEKICLKAMRKRPEDRFQSARELRTELRALLGHDDAYSAEPEAPALPPSLLQQIEARPRRGGLLVAGVVLAVSVVAGGVFFPRKDAASGATPSRDRVQNAAIAAAPSARPAPLTAPAAPGPVAAPLANGGDAPLATGAADEPQLPVAGKSKLAPEPVTMRTRVAPRTNARRGAGAVTKGGRGGSSIPIGADEVAPLPEPGAAATPTTPAASAASAAGEAAPAAPSKPAPDGKGTPPAKASPAPKQDPLDAPLPVFPIPGESPPPAAPAAPAPAAPAPAP